MCGGQPPLCRFPSSGERGHVRTFVQANPLLSHNVQDSAPWLLTHRGSASPPTSFVTEPGSVGLPPLLGVVRPLQDSHRPGDTRGEGRGHDNDTADG